METNYNLTEKEFKKLPGRVLNEDEIPGRVKFRKKLTPKGSDPLECEFGEERSSSPRGDVKEDSSVDKTFYGDMDWEKLERKLLEKDLLPDGFPDSFKEIYGGEEELESLEEKEYNIKVTYYYDVAPKNIKTAEVPVSAYSLSKAFFKARQKYPNVQDVEEV